MVNAIVLVNVDRGHVNDIAEKLVELDGVTEVFSVAGRYDLAAILRSSRTNASPNSSPGISWTWNTSLTPRR